MPGEEGYMLASSATEFEMRMHMPPERMMAMTTHSTVVISKRPDIMVKELVPKAIPAPKET
jgi:hypothetical protein